jgi:hypothetical protein
VSVVAELEGTYDPKVKIPAVAVSALVRENSIVDPRVPVGTEAEAVTGVSVVVVLASTVTIGVEVDTPSELASVLCSCVVEVASWELVLDSLSVLGCGLPSPPPPPPNRPPPGPPSPPGPRPDPSNCLACSVARSLRSSSGRESDAGLFLMSFLFMISTPPRGCHAEV